MTLKLIQTGDGSFTLFVHELNEHYHSTFGAVNESRHIFINAGFNYFKNITEQINIFEFGFGTGLNAFLTLFEARKNKQKVNYTTIEPNPLDKDIFSKLNYFDFIKDKNAEKIFLRLHQNSWNKHAEISKGFFLLKIKSKIEDVALDPDKYHLVYFDAFAPEVQPELWTEQIFQKVYNSMRNNGVLVTYSAKGMVKRNMIFAGLKVEKLPGPKGKREFIRAVKN
ncbi:MAG: tRNA (5-methylaminomethyl-2-thiouridine)(34)-methyltransferase MnmD [Bacteroidetes bacterium]|nr:tRNA (5-methylaminomethyl-2-thiouridine)(34)-methyltransferase MnmD [Bacteroidota bacterium]